MGDQNIMERHQKVSFTPEEVNQHTIFKGVPPVLRLLKSNDLIPEGKSAYSKLLGTKISKLLPSRMTFSFSGGLKIDTEKGNGRCYADCRHGKSSPVTFKLADVQQDRSLDFSVVLKCDICLGYESVQVEKATSIQKASSTSLLEETLTAPVLQQASTTTSGISAVNFRPPSAASPFVQHLSERFSRILNRLENICGNSPDAIGTFREKEEDLKEEVLAAIQVIYKKLPAAPEDAEEEEPQIVEENVTEKETSTDAQVPSKPKENFFDRMMPKITAKGPQELTQAQKRKLEQEAAKKAKLPKK
jgi:hypothetical protein